MQTEQATFREGQAHQDLPACRHRGAELAPGHYACGQPKLLVGPQGVTAEICRACHQGGLYCDQPVSQAEWRDCQRIRRGLPPPEHRPPAAPTPWDPAALLAAFTDEATGRVTKTEYQQRLTCCDGCSARTGNACQHCGCRLSRKAELQKSRCPLGKWPEPRHRPGGQPHADEAAVQTDQPSAQETTHPVPPDRNDRQTASEAATPQTQTAASAEAAPGEVSDCEPGPGPVRKAGNFGRAVVRHVANHRKRVSDNLYRQRLALCRECDCCFVERMICRHRNCGCRLLIKARWQSEDCPLGKWPDALEQDPCAPATGQDVSPSDDAGRPPPPAVRPRPAADIE